MDGSRLTANIDSIQQVTSRADSFVSCLHENNNVEVEMNISQLVYLRHSEMNSPLCTPAGRQPQRSAVKLEIQKLEELKQINWSIASVVSHACVRVCFMDWRDSDLRVLWMNECVWKTASKSCTVFIQNTNRGHLQSDNIRLCSCSLSNSREVTMYYVFVFTPVSQFIVSFMHKHKHSCQQSRRWVSIAGRTADI